MLETEEEKNTAKWQHDWDSFLFLLRSSKNNAKQMLKTIDYYWLIFLLLNLLLEKKCEGCNIVTWKVPIKAAQFLFSRDVLALYTIYAEKIAVSNLTNRKARFIQQVASILILVEQLHYVMPQLRFAPIYPLLYALGKLKLSILWTKVLTLTAVEYITAMFSILFLVICIWLVYTVIEAPLVIVLPKGNDIEIHWL